MNRLKFTFKAWPVITAVTIGLCYATQAVAELFGIKLPDQANLELVRRCALHALDSLKNFGIFAFLVTQIVIIMPALEEFIFRWLLFKIPAKFITASKAGIVIAAISSALFAGAHYIFQPWPDAAFLALFFFGLAQCWLYGKTSRIWCSMLNHALFNLTNLVLLFFVAE